MHKKFCCLSLVLLAGALAAAAADKRPNILYCLADDWSWPHAGVYGDRVVRTPSFDRVAREGMRFSHCFSAASSCTPSRAAMLTGQYPHRLEEGSCLWGFLPKKFPVYPELLEKAGYAVGSTRKGWGPGDFRAGGYARNPAGKGFRDFETFLKTVPAGTPFCFWFGSHDPHRPYEAGSGAGIGLKTNGVVIPPYWPNNEVSRSDVLDYYWKVQRFDRDVGGLLDVLEKAGQRDNTLVIMTGDNGWPFPRCKANVYDGGSRQPLAIRWPARVYSLVAVRRKCIRGGSIRSSSLTALSVRFCASSTSSRVLRPFRFRRSPMAVSRRAGLRSTTPRLSARATMVFAIAASLGSTRMSRTKDWSIFNWSSGRRFR